MLSKNKKGLLFLSFIILTVTGIGFELIRLMPANADGNLPVFSSEFSILEEDKSAHQLTVKRFKQVGSEIHLLTYTSSPGLSPFSAFAEQHGDESQLEPLSGPPSAWLKFRADRLDHGSVRLKIKSKTDTLCQLAVEILFDARKAEDIADSSLWFRHGSVDDYLDVRVFKQGDRYFLKDFADYQDGRNRVYFLEGMVIDSLESTGVEVKPGYLYVVTARWIDESYTQWWNKSRNRTSRLQAIWINPAPSSPVAKQTERLAPISIPHWFAPSRTFNPQFDTLFPEFAPAENKLVMMYRLNQDISPDSYLKRGVTHLSRWEHDIPSSRQHWTEAPGFFGDQDQQWFSRLSKKETEDYADRVGNIGVYAYDFEFWNRQYSPKIKQRLLWFSRRLKENTPSLYLFDYWGGSAYLNTTFQHKDGQFSPLSFYGDYRRPQSNHFNFEKSSDGDFFGNYFNINIVDVYPRPPLLVGRTNYTLNNYLVLSAIHASRINRLFNFQKNNKTIWFAWNRYMPLYSDPPFPWYLETANPAGALAFNGLETIPASQALALSLFSLVEGDGFYLWHDSQPWGRGRDNYRIDNQTPYQPPTEWWPTDGFSTVDKFSLTDSLRESPRYWDYGSDFFALGNWMASETGDITNGGTRFDLPVLQGEKWIYPEKEQAVLAAEYQLPFVTAVQKGNRILVLALDSFQNPNQERKLTVKLPDGTEAVITLFGNWPSLYKGELLWSPGLNLSE